MRKRKSNKFIALILTFVMLFSLGGNTVLAGTTDGEAAQSLNQEQTENETKLTQENGAIAFSPGEEYQPDLRKIDLPDNFPKVNMANNKVIQTRARATKTNGKARYNVLVLDTSASADFVDSSGNVFYTADTAIEYVKVSANKFIEGVQDADGENYVAIVEYKGGKASTVYPFSKDYEVLNSAIDSLYASGTTRNVASGLQLADTLINEIDDPEALKNVVLFTTGMTNDGEYNYDGHYNEETIGSSWRRMDTGVRLYAYSNVAYSAAENLKNKATLYSVGLFQMMEDMPEEGKEVVQFFKLFASELATTSEYFYDVKDPNELEFVFGEIADDIKNEIKEITFKYQSGKDYTAKCFYTDDYFSESAYTYNPSLATMSLSYAMSAFGSSTGGQNEYSNKSVNAKELLKKIGIEEKDIEDNPWFGVKPTTDSIGVIAGNKKINVNGEEITLIAVAVRGGGYEREWASNFTIGTSGQHEGFKKAKYDVLDFLEKYIKDHEISGNVKFWITGYSRAAATANLVSGAIDDGYLIGGAINYSNQDVYAYCFETPAGALEEEVYNIPKYNNIFNRINSSDPVPYVAPASMGFKRYGINKYFPSAESDPEGYAELKGKMLKKYNALDSTSKYVVDDFQMKKLAGLKNWLPGGEKLSLDIQDDTKHNYSQGVFLSNYVTILAKEFIKTRNNYVENYQDEIREICSVVFGCSDKQTEVLMNSIMRQAKDEWGALAWSYVWHVGFNPWGDEEDALQTVSNWLVNAVNEAGITDCDQKTLDAAGKDLGDLMLALISNHPNYFTTAVMNGSGLGAAHYPELCYAWLASMDDNYDKNNEDSFNNGGYRIIRINCDVDIEVLDSSGNLVAAIENEEPKQIENYEYISGVDENGQKYIVLPNKAEYTVTVTARNDDTVNYSINEYSAVAGEYTRNKNYFDIEMKKGEQLTGIIPAYTEEEILNDTPEGSDAEYRLLDNNNIIIDSDSDMSGEEAIQAYYNVTVTSSNEKYGIVSGTNLYQYGEFAQIEAAACEGYVFMGWYVDDKCISKDEVHRFCVTDNVEVIGRFEEKPEHTHRYGNPKFDWASDYLKCVATFKCQEGDDAQSLECSVTCEKVKDKKNNVQLVYTAKVKFNGKEYYDTLVKSEEIHDTENNNSDNKTNEKRPVQTGDTSNILLWIMLCSVAFFIGIALILYRKKINK